MMRYLVYLLKDKMLNQYLKFKNIFTINIGFVRQFMKN